MVACCKSFCCNFLCWFCRKPTPEEEPLKKDEQKQKIDGVARRTFCLKCKSNFENAKHYVEHVASNGTKHRYHTYCADSLIREGGRSLERGSVNPGSCVVDGCNVTTTRQHQIIRKIATLLDDE